MFKTKQVKSRINKKRKGLKMLSLLGALVFFCSNSFAQMISSLSYPTPTVAIANEQTLFLSPNLSGNPTGYNISPALPAGLSFDSNTGVISGMGTVASPATNYTITANGAQNSISTVIELAVSNSYFDNNYNELSFGGAGVTVINGSTGATISSTTTTTYGTAVGDKVVYKNIATLSGTSIDCIVTTVSSNVSSWTAYDMDAASGSGFSGNSSSFFSPQVNFPNSNGKLVFNFQFILGGTYSTITKKGTNVTLQDVKMNSYDIDGNGQSNSNQSTDFGGFSSYELASSTNMNGPTLIDGLTTFKSSKSANTSDALDPKNRVRVTYNGISNFSLSFGGGGTAYFFLEFGAGPTFSTAVTSTAPIIDLNTNLTGVNNNNSGCGSALNFTNSSQTNISTSPAFSFSEFSVSFPTDQLLDASNEELWISGTTSGTKKIPLNSNFTTGQTFTLNSVNYNSVVATTTDGIRTIVFKKSSGTFTTAQAESLLDAMQYNNKANIPTPGNREFTVNASTTTFKSPDAIFTASLNCVSISGHIYHDVNGMVDSKVNGTGASQFPANFAYAVLVDPTNDTVIANRGIDTGGAYTFGTASPGKYIIYLCDTIPTIGSTFTIAHFPTGYVSTGENLGSDVGNDFSADGKLLITIGSSVITDANFGIQIPPTSANKTLSNVSNPGGFNFYSTPTNSFLASDSDGQIDSITINSFPTGANYLKIGTTYYTNPIGGVCPPQATCTAWPGSVTIPYTGGNPALDIAVDPIVEGNTAVVINYKAWDNAKAQSNNSNLTLNFIGGATYKTIAGTVWNDANGDGIKTTSEPLVNTANTGEILYALLIQNTNTYSTEGTILNAVTVSSTSGYSFSNVPTGNDYTIKIVSLPNPPIKGAKSTTITPNLANNWIGVSTNVNGTIVAYQSTNNLQIALTNLTANQSNLNFGIEQLPESNSETVVLTTNPSVGSVFVLDGAGQFPIPTGSDAEDGNLGATKKIKITTLPTNSTMQYNGVTVTLGQEIANFNPLLLKIVLTSNTLMALSTEFKFTYVDNAKQIDPTPATYKISWSTPLPLTFVSFTVEAGKKVVHLKWETAREQNNKGFGVERSINGKDWKNLGFISTNALNGNSTSLLSYTFDDISPLVGQNFYRIQQIDIDGTIQYSNVKEIVWMTSKNDISIVPNPTKGSIRIIGTTPNETIFILNSIGQKILTKKVKDFTTTIDLSKLPNGIYLVVISDENGYNTTQKVIKD